MKVRASIWSAAILVAAYAGSAGAEIYRCIAGGSVSYQEFPCPAAAETATMPIGADFPAINAVERDRLLQREAALDARLEAQRDRQSRETVAAIGRDAQVQAAQAQAEADTPVYYALGRPRLIGPRSLRPVAHRPRPS